jgi:hypothetical protein
MTPHGSGLWNRPMHRTLRTFIAALRAQQPSNVSDDHAHALLTAIEASVSAIEQAAGSAPPPTAEATRRDPHGLYGLYPLHSTLLHQSFVEECMNDPHLQLLGRIYWRLAMHGSARSRWYDAMLAWRRIGQETLSYAARRELDRAISAETEHDVGNCLSRISSSIDDHTVSEHVGELSRIFTIPPWPGGGPRGGPGGGGVSGNTPSTPLARAVTGKQSPRAGRPGPDCDIDIVTGATDVDESPADLYTPVPATVGHPHETPGGRRKAEQGRAHALARANNHVVAPVCRPIAEGALQQLRDRADAAADPAVRALFWVHLLLARGLNEQVKVYIRDLDRAPETLGKQEIGYSPESGTIYIHRVSPVDDPPREWILALGPPVTAPIISAFQQFLGLDQPTVLLNTQQAADALAKPLPLEFNELPKKKVVTLLRVLDQRAREDGHVSPVVVDLLYQRRPPPGLDTPHQYCHPSPGTLSAEFQAAVERLFLRLGWLQPGVQADLLRLSETQTGDSFDERDPGMDRLRSAAQTTIRRITDANAALRDLAKSGSEQHQARSELDEAIAMYTWIQVGLACAARDVTSPAPDWWAFSADNPLALLTDKNAHGVDEARIVGLPKAVRQTLDAYRRYIEQRGATLGHLPNPNPTLLVPVHSGTTRTWESITPSWIRRVRSRHGLPDAPPNALRHRAATWSADYGLARAVQAFLMNHWGHGQQPVGGHSLLSPQGVAAVLEPVVDQLLHAVGVSSPLDELTRI